MAFRFQDESPRGSAAFTSRPASRNGHYSGILHQPQARPTASASAHLRRRSSTSALPSPSSFGHQLSSPFVQLGRYDDRTGEIALPPSPPLPVWKEKNALGLTTDDARGYKKGRKFVGPLPWRPILGLFAMIASFVTLLSYLVPSTSQYTPKAMLNRIRVSSQCEPFSSFGTLIVDDHDADKNQWVPFDPTCSPPAFMAKLREQSHMADLGLTNLNGGSSLNKNKEDFAWLRHRTALIIGDSVSREHVENFCQLLGEESEAIRPGHKYAVQDTPKRAATKAHHVSDKPSRLNSRAIVRDSARPRMCYVPQYDFLLVSVLHFGLDQEDFWRDRNMPQYTSPGNFEHRLSDIIQPMMNAIRADGRPAAPDYVEVTSGAWDLARWAEQDVASGSETTSGLTQDRVTWYRFRVGQVLDKVRKAFPNAKVKTWRTMHYPTDQFAEKDYFMDKISKRNLSSTIEQPFFPHNRIYQLDQAVRTLMTSAHVDIASSGHVPPYGDFRISEWGPILKGHQAHQLDRLHGDPLPGGYVWSDIMLYELSRGIIQGERAKSIPSSFEGPSRSHNRR
ncbi:hypothetical protein OIO90_005997 [Microbotryomycetes sp. JL221]|nr:hypothetical protein OIO90_005997 [Microbotryomycetes sp. JL221]